MRILIISDGAYLPKIDGVVVSVLNMTKLLVRKGHVVGIVAAKYEGYRDRRQENIKIYRLRSFPLLVYPEVRLSYPNFTAIKKIIKDFKPDIIHTQTPSGTSILALMIANYYGIPIITTYHASFPDMAAAASPIKLLRLDSMFDNISKKYGLDDIQKKFQDAMNKSRKNKRQKNDSISRKAILSITNLFYNRHKTVIVPSQEIKKDLRKHNLKSKIFVVSNGIDIKKFRKKEDYNRFPKFLHVGRVSYEKKIPIVLEAMSAVVKRYPHATLTVAGDGPAMHSIRKTIKNLRLEENVTLIGFIPMEKISDVYRKHDVFVTASEMETQGLVVLEAMASGLPVIGVDALAIPDVLHNKKNGFLEKKEDHEGIAKSMCRFIENPDLISEYGKNAREEAEKHDVATCIKKIEDIYIKNI